MINKSLIGLGKTVSKISQTLNRGNGSTWPGHIALKGNPNFIKDILSQSQTQIIIVAGTNGKTTTSGLIKTGLENNGKTVIQNTSGANLLNGVASTLLLHTNAHGKLTQDFAIFEVDENALPLVLRQINPDYLVLLNLFRDQLDRYGEIHTIAQKWQEAISKLSEKTKLILNADDPQIAFLGLSNVIASGAKQTSSINYFGLQENKTNHTTEHAADSVSCPKCRHKLTFATVNFSHLGKWHCTFCGLTRPNPTRDSYSTYPLSGTYNKYNTITAALVLQNIGLNDKQITSAFENFSPAFGRQEIIGYRGKKAQLFLSKNPTSFNQSYATIQEQHASTLLLVLNDRIPDGHDISWIWDVDIPEIQNFKHILVAGDRVYDMALRLRYELGIKNYEEKISTFDNLKVAINAGIDKVTEKETFYILPNYSAMLDTRKILTGKKIL
jgi:lipid II isoglutaminyl synthase (glutamine-hydrolysing)